MTADDRRAERETNGGYPSGSKRVGDLQRPPTGPGLGARTSLEKVQARLAAVEALARSWESAPDGTPMKAAGSILRATLTVGDDQ